MKEIWPRYKTDSEFMMYFPDFDDMRCPPRLYFFQMLSAFRPQKYNNLIKESKLSRQKTAELHNKIISVDEQIWTSLSKARLHENLITSGESKRILMARKGQSK